MPNKSYVDIQSFYLQHIKKEKKSNNNGSLISSKRKRRVQFILSQS